MFSRKVWVTLSLFMVFALGIAACGPGAANETVVPTVAEGGVETLPPATLAPTMAAGAETPAATMAAETPAATTAAGGAGNCPGVLSQYQDLGGTVNVLATWGGAEQDSFMAMVQPFEDCTGVQVQYEGTRDLNAVLTTRVQGGNPPELAGVPGPGQLNEFAASGALVPLNQVLDLSSLQNDYDQGWLDLATVNGNLYGIFIKASLKSQIWYNPQAFNANNYTVPQNWDQMQQLEQTIISNGNAPWCIALELGAASGWPGTDWIEDFVLVDAGPQVYDQWVKHEIPWTSDQIKQAWQDFGDIVNNPDMVYGGQQYVLSTNFGEAAFPLFSDPVGCYMTHSASFMPGFITDQFPDLKAGASADYNFFPFPPKGQNEAPVEVAGDLFGMFNDTPQAEALLNWLTTADAQSIWAQRGGFLSANRSVPASAYPDELTQKEAETIATAPAVRFDASDQMPEAVNNAFWSGILDYVSNPSDLDNILQQIEQVAQDAYSQQGAAATATP